MIRAITTIALITLLLAQPFAAQTTAEKRAAKMKAEVEKLGTGPNARLTVELGDKTRLTGYVSKINDKTFVLVSDGTGAATEIEYSDAKVASKRGGGLPKAAQIVIAVGAVIGGFIVFCAASGRCQQ